MTLALAAVLCATGCKREKIDFGGDDVSSQGVGYLALTDMSVNVNSDAEEVETRTLVLAPENYIVTVINSSTSETAYESTYGEIADAEKEGKYIELAPGSYRIEAKSPNAVSIALMAWDAPAYAGSVSATVIKNQTTTAPAIECKLANIKTTVSLDENLKALFLNDGTNDLRTDVSLGENTMRFVRDETRAAYFRAVEAENTLTVVLTGSYNTGSDSNPSYKPVSMTKTISGVTAGQWRKISISVQHSDQGNVTFVIDVETWMYDEKIDVDVMSANYTFGEEEIPDEGKSDPDAPVVTLNNDKDITAVYQISASDFDDEDSCSNRIDLIVTPQGGTTLSSVSATFDSDNSALLSALASAGYDDYTVDLLAMGAYITISDYGSSGAKRFYVLSKGMKHLFDYAGTHTVKITATDSQNRTSYTTMTIKSVKSSSSEGGPTIVWVDHDIDVRYPTSELGGEGSVVIKVHSDTGITAFQVDILGDVLTESDLASLGLASSMDLINPATEEMNDFLVQLQFPTKDNVEGKNDVEFDISQFMSMLAGLGKSGNCDFRLTVSDSEGTTAKAIQLNVVAL